MLNDNQEFSELTQQIKQWGYVLGFQQVGISDIDLEQAETRLKQWLHNKYHGCMDYMEKHGSKRSHPEELLPGTIRVISLRMDYFPSAIQPDEVLENKKKAYIAVYALGRDYHKVIRARLKEFAKKIHETIEGSFASRFFVDSAPVMEKPLAEKAGLGWIGKNTNLINSKAGSWFFLGELFTDLPLSVDKPATNHCGSCTACIDICPTKAIIAPYQLDARRCIAYLTIEYRGSIPLEFRSAIGNRVFGCDDCQLVCPWNKFARATAEGDFAPRKDFTSVDLIQLFSWTEDEFLMKTQGSPIRRIGYECWLRNLAIALGNAPSDSDVLQALQKRRDDPSALVQEHVKWALEQHS